MATRNRFLFLLVLGSATRVVPECTEFSVSECSGDQNAVYLQINTSRDKCQQYCNIEEDCKFYRYSERPVQGVNCLLYKEPFSTFTSHCKVRSGPKSAESKCLSPTEDTCDIVQSGKCIYQGRTVESFPSLELQDCIALCQINPGCKLWMHNQESKKCELLDSAEAICNEVFGPSSKLPVECGEEAQSTTTDSSRPTPPVPINCPANGMALFPDEEDCGKYWECYNGQVTGMTCTNCYLFDEKNSWCAPPEFVQCGSRPYDHDCQATTAPGPCPFPDGYYKDPDSCTNYYICQGGVSVQRKCEKKADGSGKLYQLLYNYDAVQCDYPYRVNCEDRPICDENYENCQCQGAAHVDPAHVCPDGDSPEIVPDPFNCAIYYVCVGGEKVETILCPQGQYYDVSIAACSSSPSVCNGRPICTTGSGVNDCRCYVP